MNAEMHEQLNELHQALLDFGVSNKVGNTIETAFTKTQLHIREKDAFHKVVMVSVSGGSDSDIMLDLIERVKHPNNEVHYVFFNTGMEFNATKKHLDYLEQKYGITIARYRAKTPVPLAVKKYGVPFLSKNVSEYIYRLQKHGFKWEDRSFDELYAEYPKCKAALRWWCNEFGENSRINISRHKYLKEFMIQTPPDFQISPYCCQGAKKDTAHMIEKEIHPDLICQGLRQAEGGARSTIYKSCFDEVFDSPNQFRPIFWFLKEDKATYEKLFNVIHSECYSRYGLSRTGCACCPFGLNFEQELKAAEKYEPNLFLAANNVFGKSYEYTRKYHDFRKKMTAEEKESLTT